MGSIYKIGDKIRCINDFENNWGGCHSIIDNLKIDEIYTIENIEVHSWHTRFWLEGIPNKFFNSVHFTKESVNQNIVRFNVPDMCGWDKNYTTYHIGGNKQLSPDYSRKNCSNCIAEAMYEAEKPCDECENFSEWSNNYFKEIAELKEIANILATKLSEYDVDEDICKYVDRGFCEIQCCTTCLIEWAKKEVIKNNE